MKLILASASPRRSELLNMLGVDFDVRISEVDEDALARDITDPAQLVEVLSAAKCAAVAQCAAQCATTLSADTIVYLDGAVLGKPADTDDARRMLRAMSGKRHTVYTGVSVMAGGVVHTAHRATDVYFRALTDDEIDHYVAGGEPMDKAGAYGAQGVGALLIERIDGDFFNVVGLPLTLCDELLRRVGIRLL